MQITQTAGPAIFENALKDARRVGAAVIAPGLDGLNSPLTDDGITWVDRIWDQIEGALGEARRATQDTAAKFKARAIELYCEAKDALGQKVDTVTAVLLDRLNAFVAAVVDGVLRSMPASLSVGNEAMLISSVSVSRAVSLSGSFELALDRVLSFVATGELTVDVSYLRGAKGEPGAE